MNQRDKDNLDFLLNASPDVIEDWYSKMADDDIDYAFELLEQLAVELEQKLLTAQFGNKNVVIAQLTNTVH